MRKSFVKIVDNIKVDKIETRNLYDEACKQTHQKDTLILNQDNVYRWMVNTVRHSYSNYESGIRQLHRNNNSEEEYHMYKNAVLDKISYEYPNLKDECDKQKESINMVRIIKKKRKKKYGRKK